MLSERIEESENHQKCPVWIRGTQHANTALCTHPDENQSKIEIGC